MNSVGDTIFFMRKKAGITLEKLAESIHVSRQALQNWEKGRRDCSITMLSLICDNLGYTITIDGDKITFKSTIDESNVLVSSLKTNPSCIKIVEEDGIYSICISYKSQNNIISFNKEDASCIKGYSIIFKDYGFTPNEFELWYDKIEKARAAINEHKQYINFPEIYNATIETKGELIFVEQIEKTLRSLGFNKKESEKFIYMVAKKDIYAREFFNNKFNIKSSSLEEDYFYLISKSIPGAYRKERVDDIIQGFTMLIDGLSCSSNGKIDKIHQLNILMQSIITIASKEGDAKELLNDSKLWDIDDYKSVINKKLNEPIFVYGYPSFREKALKSIQ